MQNEKLFNKIRETALDNTSEAEDYNPEKVWTDIQRKKNRNRLSWWYYAAASVIVLIGFYAWNSTENKRIVADGNKIQIGKFSETGIQDSASRPVASVVLDTSQSKQPKQGIADSQDNRLSNRPAEILKDAAVLVFEAPIPNEFTSTNETVVPMDTVRKQSLIINQQNPGKVLIAEIEIPEEEPVQPSALTEIFDQVKKGREAKRMRVKFENSMKRKGIWAFVHQSFYEAPHDEKPSTPAKSIR